MLVGLTLWNFDKLILILFIFFAFVEHKQKWDAVKPVRCFHIFFDNVNPLLSDIKRTTVFRISYNN